MSGAYPNAVFSAFAFTGFLLCAIPFPWHLEAWNTGTCLYMAWTGLACLNLFINSVIWTDNAIDWAPVWCDISTKFFIGCTVAIPAASLCINRRLYHISSVRSVTITKAQKRRDVMVDLAIGLGIPVLEMILHYIPQGHRYNIFEDVGCLPSTYNTWVAYVLVYCPPIAIGCVSGVYAFLSIRNFNQSRSQFNDLLSGHANLTSSRYVRLMCLAGTEVLFTVPLGSFAVFLNVKAGISPWISWEDTHFGFSRVDQILAVFWRADLMGRTSIELSRWLPVVCAFIFFAYFGFADEARKNYRSYLQTVAKRVGISTTSTMGKSGAFGSMNSKVVGSDGKIRPAPPLFVHQEFLRRQSSLDSFSDMSTSIGDVSGYLGDKKEKVSLNEKDAAFLPTLSYNNLSFSDVGGTLADYKDEPYSPSGASSISIPEPALTRSSSLHSLPSPIPSLTTQKAHTHDIV